MMLGPKPGGKKDMKKAAKPGSSTPDHKGEDSSASEAEPATSSQKKEKPSSSKSHGSSRGESKATKRKLFMVSNILDEGDEKKTPERKRKKTGDDASASTPSRPIPLSERQQLALIMQMTAAESGSPGRNGSPSGASNDRRSSEPTSAKKKNDKVNKRNERGETPLHMAAIKGDAEMLKQLIKQGAEVNAKDFAGWTPLHEACNHGYYEVAKMLLQAGANVNTQGLDDDTPLHDAASNGHPHIVELLLKHGADPLQANTKGKTPIDVADNDTVERLLKSETIASSSDSSDSLDVKSPTSPESLASLNDETSVEKKTAERERKHAEGNEFEAEGMEQVGLPKPKESVERHRHPSKGEFSKSPGRCSTKSPSNIFEKIEKISAIKKEADRRFAFESSDSDRSRSSTPEIRLSRLPKPREDGKEKAARDKVKVLKTYSRSSDSRKDQEPMERTEDTAKPAQAEAEVSEKHRHKQTLPERHFDSDSEIEASSVSSSVSREESVERKESKKEAKKEARLQLDSGVKTPKMDGKHHEKGTKRKREEDSSSGVGSGTSCETKEKPSSEVKVKHKHLAKRSGIPGTMPDGTIKKKIKGDKNRDGEKREKYKHVNMEGKKSEERRTKDMDGRSEIRKEKENEGKNSPQGGEIRRHSLPDLSASTKKEKLKELKKMASLSKPDEEMFGKYVHSSHSKSKGDDSKVRPESSKSDGPEAALEKFSEKHSKSEKAEKKLDGQERHLKTDKGEVKVHKGEKLEGKISKGERSEEKSSKVDRSEEKRLKLEKAEKRHKSEHKSKESKGEHSQKVPHSNVKLDSIQLNAKSDGGKHFKRKDEQKHHKSKSEASLSSEQSKVLKHKSDKVKPVNLERLKSSSSESLQSSTSSEVKAEKHSPKAEKMKLEKHKAELKVTTLDRLKSSSSESLQSTDSFKGDRQKMKHHDGKGEGGKGSPQLERTGLDSPKVHRAQEKSARSDSCNSERSGIESPALDKPREKVKLHKGEKSGHGHESPRLDKQREKERHKSGSSKESPVKDRTKEKHRTEHGKETKKGTESPRDDKLFPWKPDRSGLDSPKRDKTKAEVLNRVDGSKTKEGTKVKHNLKGEKVKVDGSKRVESKPHTFDQDLFKPDRTSVVKQEKLKTFDLFEGEVTDKSKHVKIVRIPKVKKDSDKGDSLRPDKIKEGGKHDPDKSSKSEHPKADKEKVAQKAEKSREGERKEKVKLDGKDSHSDGSKPHRVKSDKHKGESSKQISSKSKTDKERLKVKEKRPETSTNATHDTPDKERVAAPQKEERPALSFPAIPSYLREEPETMKEKYIKVSPKTESIVTLEADLSEKPLPERSSVEPKDTEDRFVEPFNKSHPGRPEIKETTLQLTPSVSLSPSESFPTTTTSSPVPKASITTTSATASPVTVTTTTVSYTASISVSSTSVTVLSSSISSPTAVVRPTAVTSAYVTGAFSTQTVATTSVPVTTSPALVTTTTTSSMMTFTCRPSKPQGVIAGPIVTQASSSTSADYLKSLLLKPKVSQMIVSERPKVHDTESTTPMTVDESTPASQEEPEVRETATATLPVVKPVVLEEKTTTPPDQPQLKVKETFPKSQLAQGGSFTNDSGAVRSTPPQASIPVHVITPTPASKPTEEEKTTQKIPAPVPVPLPQKEEAPVPSVPAIGMVVSTSVTSSSPSGTVLGKPEVQPLTTDVHPTATKESIIELPSTEEKTVPPSPAEVFITTSSIPAVPLVVTSVELVETTVVTTVCVETNSSTNTSVALLATGQPIASLAQPPQASSPGIKQEEDGDKPQRITRSMRSTSSQASTPPIPSDKFLLQEDSNSQMSMGSIKIEGNATSVEDCLENVHPFRRKVLKVKNIASLDEPYVRPRPEKPNPYWEYLNIRKVILERRQNMSVVIPKPPQCFDEYLLYQCSYLLHSRPDKSLIIPMYTPPASLPEEMTELFVEQEKARHKIRLEHYLEREKLIMSCEQEILRVHCRAARAHANQSVPFSACKILLDEEVYNVPPEQRTEDKPQGRDRFTARQFHSWLQDVDEKYEAAKNCLLLRHHHEATSLQAVQKMEWQLRLQDLGYKDVKSLTDINDFYVPMVTVSEDFDLLPA